MIKTGITGSPAGRGAAAAARSGRGKSADPAILPDVEPMIVDAPVMGAVAVVFFSDGRPVRGAGGGTGRLGQPGIGFGLGPGSPGKKLARLGTGYPSPPF